MKKKEYTLLGNIKYIFGKMFEYKKSLKYKILLRIVLKLIMPLGMSLLPAIAVGLIKRKADIKEFIGVMLISVAVYAAVTFLEQYEINIMFSENVAARMKMFYMESIRKQITTDYNNVEPQDKQLMFHKAFASIMGNNVGTELMMKSVPDFILNIAEILLYGGMVTVLDYKIILVLIVMTVSNFILSHYARKFENDIKDEKSKIERNMSYIFDNANSAVNGKDERIYHMEIWFVKIYKELTKKRINIVRKKEYRYFLPEFSDNIWLFIRDILAYGMLTAGVVNGTISIEKFTFFLGILSSFSAQLKEAGDSLSGMETANITICDYRKYTELENTYNHGKGVEIDKSTPVSIEFKNMSFRYPGADKDTIHNLNLKINAKSKIALVGLNGAGKTTLVKIISGLYYPTEGDVLINGKSIMDFNIDEYHNLIGTVFQDIEPLAFTIAQNVAPLKESEMDYDRVNECFKRAGLMDKIGSLKNKEKTYLMQTFSKDGIMLSGGELQKMMLARALYKDAPVMILDEPTAALDPIAESELYEGYNNLTKDKTSIFISHRLSSTKFCDRILFFKDGNVVEDGNHDELMKRNGEYANMFDIQSHYYKEGTK